MHGTEREEEAEKEVQRAPLLTFNKSRNLSIDPSLVWFWWLLASLCRSCLGHADTSTSNKGSSNAGKYKRNSNFISSLFFAKHHTCDPFEASESIAEKTGPKANLTWLVRSSDKADESNVVLSRMMGATILLLLINRYLWCNPLARILLLLFN